AREYLGQVMVRRILDGGTRHRVIRTVRREPLSPGNRQRSAGHVPEIEAQHNFVKEGVRMTLVQETLTPAAECQLAIRLRKTLEVQRRAQSDTRAGTLNVEHDGRLSEVQLGLVQGCAFIGIQRR